MNHLRRLIVFALLAFKCAAQSEVSPAGIAVINDGSQTKEYSAVVEYQSLQIFGSTYKLVPVAGAVKSGLSGHIVARVEYIAPHTDLAPSAAEWAKFLDEKIRELETTLSPYKNAFEPVSKEVGRLKNDLESLRAGQVRVQGKWLPETQYASMVAASKLGEIAKFAVGDRKYAQVKVKAFAAGEILISHAGGTGRIRLEDLTLQNLEELKRTSSMLAELPEVVAFEKEFVRELSVGGKTYTGLRVISLAGEELQFSTDGGIVKTNWSALDQAQKETFAAHAATVKARVEAESKMAMEQKLTEESYALALKASRAGDWNEALRLYEIAENGGIIAAKVNRALAYIEGKGRTKDVDEGRRLLAEAYRAGDKLAAFNLGLLEYSESGSRGPSADCVDYFTKASSQGVTEADLFLAVMYGKGLGVPRDPQKARQLLMQAQKAGSQYASNMLEALERETNRAPVSK